MDRHEPPNYYGNNFPNQGFVRQGPDMMNQGYKNPYMNGAPAPDYPVPNANTPQQTQHTAPYDDSKDPGCTTTLCKMNRGKAVTVYCTFTDSAEWHDRVFKGILFSASDDNIILYNQQDGKYTIIIAVYVNFIEFYDLALLDLPKNTSSSAPSSAKE